MLGDCRDTASRQAPPGTARPLSGPTPPPHPPPAHTANGRQAAPSRRNPGGRGRAGCTRPSSRRYWAPPAGWGGGRRGLAAGRGGDCGLAAVSWWGGAGRGLKGRAHVPPRPAARRRLQGEGRNGGLEEKSGINHRRLLPLCIRVSVLENKVSRSNIVPGGAGFCVRFHCGCFWRQREPEARALLCAGGRVPWPWESCPAQC